MRSPSRRAQLALLGSLLLHGALALLLINRKPTSAPRRNAAPVSIEIIEAPAPKPAAVIPAPAKLAHAAPHAPHRHRAPAPVASHTEAVAIAPAPAPAPPQPSGPDVPSAPPTQRAPDLSAAATRAADRVSQTSLALAPPVLTAPEDRSIQAPFVIADPNARVASMLREGLGRSRVERGLVDPYFSQLGEAMDRQWEAEKHVDEKGMKGFLEEMGRGLREGARAYVAAASEYGRTGTIAGAGGPMGPDGRLQVPLHEPLGGSEQLPGMWRSTRVALVRLTQRPDGHLLAVELVQPSIDAAMDAEILRELRRGTMKLPVPPTEGQGIHDPIRSIWAFQLVVSIAPPVPNVIGGTFDLDALFDKKTREENGGSLVDVRLPLSRRITKRVQLISVE